MNWSVLPEKCPIDDCFFPAFCDFDWIFEGGDVVDDHPVLRSQWSRFCAIKSALFLQISPYPATPIADALGLDSQLDIVHRDALLVPLGGGIG